MEGWMEGRGRIDERTPPPLPPLYGKMKGGEAMPGWGGFRGREGQLLRERMGRVSEGKGGWGLMW